MRTRWIVQAGVAVAALAIVTTAFLPTEASRRQCEDEVARAMVPAGGVVYIPRQRLGGGNAYSAPYALEVFRRVGAAASEMERDAAPAYPQATINRGQFRFPFVEVESGLARAPLPGEGRRTRFLCILGRPVRVSEEESWTS